MLIKQKQQHKNSLKTKKKGKKETYSAATWMYVRGKKIKKEEVYRKNSTCFVYYIHLYMFIFRLKTIHSLVVVVVEKQM